MPNVAFIPKSIILSRFSNGKEKLTKLAVNYIVAMFSYVKPGDIVDAGKDYKAYFIPKAELKNKFGFKKGGYYRDLIAVCEEITRFKFNIANNPNENLLTENIKIINMQNAMFIEVRISGGLLKKWSIKEGTEGFTSINVNHLVSFKSECAKKMLLELSDSSWNAETEREYSEEEIRELLGLQKKYSRISDVLYHGFRVAKSEFDKQINTEFYFTYKPKKGWVRSKCIGVIVTKHFKKEISVSNLTLNRPQSIKLAAQVRRAPTSDQLDILKWTIQKFPKQADQILKEINK